MPPPFKFTVGARVWWGDASRTRTVPWIVHQRNYWQNAEQVLIHYGLVPADRPLAPARWVEEGELVADDEED